MSGLFTTLSRASNALAAQQYGLDVTGQNIANLNTDGYARRTVQLAETPQTDPMSPGGVDVQGVQAQRDAILDARLRAEIPAGEQQGAIANSLNTVQAALGDPGSSIDSQLSSFFDAFATLAQDPTSSTARDGVVQQGKQLATAFHDLSSRLSQARTAADAQVRGTVTDINQLVARIASLNNAMASSSADQATLQDQQNVALDSLAKLANITVMQRQGGGVDVTIGQGNPLVVGNKAYALTVGSAGISGMATVVSNGTDITAQLTDGKIGGALQVRDSFIPAYQSQLDTLAANVANAVNAKHAAGYTLGGATGQNFFTVPPAGNVGAAAAFDVDPAVVSDPTLVAASSIGTAGDNQTAKDIASLRTTPVNANGTLIDGWSQIVYKVASDVQTATANQQVHGDVTTALQTQRDNVSKVSLDEETAQMLKFQRAYEANAKFFTTVNGVLDTLMTMVS
jgi:flagellar hook-associated protein 1 FlgK